MLSRKGILVRLQPTVEQIKLLEQMVGCCRVVSLTSLDKIEVYRKFVAYFLY